MTSAPASLNERFLAFLGAYSEAESIDRLVPTVASGKRADFLLFERSLIVEVKSLETDTAHKVETILGPYRSESYFPQFFGRWTVADVLKHFPEHLREKLDWEIYFAVTSSVEDQIEKANRQIRETRLLFGLPDSDGAVFLLNDALDVLTPQAMSRRVAIMMDKKNGNGSARYESINWVGIVSNAHVFKETPEVEGLPLIHVSNRPGPAPQQSREQFSKITNAWCRSEGMPLVELPTRDVPDAYPIDRNAPASITRSELWRRQYRANPYLAHLSDSELVAHIKSVLGVVSRGMLVGASTQVQRKARSEMDRWTHVLEEVDSRRWDVRRLRQLMSEQDQSDDPAPAKAGPPE